MKKNVLQTAAIIVATASFACLSSCSGETQQMQQGAPQIATITTSYGTANLEKSYPATIKGKTDIDVRPLVSGFITKVHVDEGQIVSKGQVLFTLDQVQYQAAVDQAQAAVLVAETAVQTAQLTANTKRSLYEKNIISEYENQLAQNSLAQAQAQLAQAKAGLVNAQKNLSYTVVTAPSTGVVGKIPNREGSLASPSMVTPLTTVSDTGDVYAYFSLTEKDILEMTEENKSLAAAIKAMPEVQLRLSDGTIYESTGKVATITGTIDSSTGAASVRALFKNGKGVLRSGSTGQVVVPHHMDSVIVIPQKATYELQDRKFVYVVGDSCKVASRPITIYSLNDGQNFIVTSGLSANEQVVVEGVGTVVKDGLVIAPVDANAKAE
ncbi:MAG: efflux RND transporter periplasmic adaptor subunit [Muribaculaceae bacterium]